MRILVNLDRLGDVINLLPLLQAEPDTRLMVLKEYAPLFEGISYSEPIIFDGQFHELGRAVQEAQAITSNVRSVTFTGDPATIKAFTFQPTGTAHATSSSFAKEVWKIAGRVDLWNEQPKLVFDRRSVEREVALLDSVCPIKRGRKRKLMLIADGGVSSPFPYRELLVALLRLKFESQYQIVNLSALRAERFYDLLALYERADVLVTTDSAPLHLAHACPDLPVVALVNDKPSLWFGSPWRANHVFHCRYSDFPERAVEMLNAIGQMPVFGHVHLWNAYHDRERRAPLRLPACQAESKVFGRDSHTSKDIGGAGFPRAPFLKDMLRMASWRCAESSSVIVLTRPDTRLLNSLKDIESPCWAHRSSLDNGNLTYHPQPDLFAFTKSFYMEHRKELPDLLCDDGPWWGRVMREWLRRHGGKELPFAIYRETPTGGKPQFSPYNEKLAKAWFDKHNVDLTYPKVSQQLPAARIHGLSPFGYNGSIIEHGGRIFLAYRWHANGDPKTVIAIAELDSKLNTLNNREVKMQGAHSFEDPRLFVHRGALWMSWVASEWPEHFNAVVRHGRLIETQYEWRVDVAPIVDYGKNDFTTTQKNWGVLIHNDDLFFIHGSTPKQIVIDVQGTEHVSDFPHWRWGTVKGGCIAPTLHQGKLLRFFHSRLDNEPRPYGHRYYIGAALMNPEPPFETVTLSSEPILRGSENDDLPKDKRLACAHHKQRVVFPMGVMERDGAWLLSVGINDSSIGVVTITEKDLKL